MGLRQRLRMTLRRYAMSYSHLICVLAHLNEDGFFMYVHMDMNEKELWVDGNFTMDAS